MNRLSRTLIVLCGAVVIAQSLILCGATGWRAFTRFPSPELARMHEQQGSLTSLFDGTGGEGGPRLIPNEFAFGWLPSPSLSAEVLSVTSVGGPALLAAVLAFIPGRAPHRTDSQERSS